LQGRGIAPLILYLDTRFEASGEIRAIVDLLPGNDSGLPFKYKAG